MLEILALILYSNVVCSCVYAGNVKNCLDRSFYFTVASISKRTRKNRVVHQISVPTLTETTLTEVAKAGPERVGFKVFVWSKAAIVAAQTGPIAHPAVAADDSRL